MTPQKEKKGFEKKGCIIKSNQDIKDLLFERFTQAAMTLTEVVRDARETHGRRFSLPMLSRYLKKGQADCALSQDDILWLCDRYGIRVHVSAKKISTNERSNLQRIKRKYT